MSTFPAPGPIQRRVHDLEAANTRLAAENDVLRAQRDQAVADAEELRGMVDGLTRQLEEAEEDIAGL